MTNLNRPLERSIAEEGWLAALAARSGLRDGTSARFLGLLIVFSVPTLLYLRHFYMADPDFGWHLRAGQWILAQHALPWTDPFSAYGAGKPWYDYSWLFDIFFAYLYKWFGLAGFLLLEVAFRITIPVFLFRLARKLGLSFWLSLLSTALAGYAMSGNYAPRPGMFTIVFLTIELELLFSAVLTGRARNLVLLPVLFWFWASIHIQFIHGLIVLAMFAGEPVLNFLLRYKPRIPALPSGAIWIFVASFVATLLTPYGWRIYSTVFLYAGQKHIYESISEMLAMNFHEPYHFALLFLVVGAAIAIGWSRDGRPLHLVLFAFSAVIGFRSIKDVWLLAVVSVAMIAVSLRASDESAADSTALSSRNRLALAVCVLAVLAVGWRRYDVDNTWIEMGLAGRYPEAAVRYVLKNNLRGPLYNDFSSGGFLIWRLPSIPVSMDGRTNVHGDDRVKAYADSLRGLPGWENDPDLAKANLIIWPAKSPLPALLRCDPRFKQVFADPQAVVFVRR
jgi:hypothetical protein